MSIQVRTGVFETNSSSMHSIAVRKEHKTATADEIQGRAWLSDGQKWVYSNDLYFERYPFKILHTFWDKAFYVIASTLGGYKHLSEDDEDAKAFLEGQLYPIIGKYCPNFKGFRFDKDYHDLLIDPNNPEDEGHCSWDKDVHYKGTEHSPSGYVLELEDGKEVPLSVSSTHNVETVDYGDIDHQSMGLLDGFFKHSGVSLEDFLTDSAYLVVIDGDEYDDFQEYLKEGLMKPEDFQTVYSSSCWWGRDLEGKLEVVPVACD